MLYDEIQEFLASNGIEGTAVRAAGKTLIGIEYRTAGRIRKLFILPAEIIATGPEEAEREYSERISAKKVLQESFGNVNTVTVAEDRWRSRPDLYRTRILAHCGRFESVFARNCKAIRTDKATAGAFLEENHNYGSARCRYYYRLEDMKHGRTVGAAAFSNARRWVKDGAVIRSYEWVRYASANGIRVAGGMGKILSSFIEDVRPDDIMSYADLEWSDGEVYRKLGFRAEGMKAPVLFRIDSSDWSRLRADAGANGFPPDMHAEGLWYMNEGSIKYRMKITDSSTNLYCSVPENSSKNR